MSGAKREFYGKEVTDAIKDACDTLNVSQEMLDIEVLETGTTGIFGLIRKKARIRVMVKVEPEPQPVEKVVATAAIEPEPAVSVEPEPVVAKAEPVVKEEKAAVVTKPKSVPEPVDTSDDDDEDDEDEVSDRSENKDPDASPENLELVKNEVETLITLMGFPSSVETTADGLTVYCAISGEFEEQLAGPEGKTLDSVQYLIRKMVARKCQERLRIMINVGQFREKRLEELKERAVELAKKVRETGKTHVLPALNPSERREIHMVLQEDKEIRSRSVGDGLFKKILIYKPGKGARGGKRKNPPRGRKPRSSRNNKNSGDE